MCENIQNQRFLTTKMAVNDKSIIKALYLVALQIAKNEKAFSVGEDLGKFWENMLSKNKKKFLSANTIKCRIEKMGEDIEDKVIE